MGDDPLVRLKVGLHDFNQVEMKLYTGNAILESKELRFHFSLVIPTALGTLKADNLLQSIWSLDRLGMGEAFDLADILEHWNDWENKIYILLDAVLGTPVDPEIGMRETSKESKIAANSLEQLLRFLGSAMKSALRDEGKLIKKRAKCGVLVAKGVYFSRFKELLKRIAALRTEVDNRSCSSVEKLGSSLVHLLEEFVLIAMETMCSRLALNFAEDRMDDIFINASAISRLSFKTLQELKYLDYNLNDGVEYQEEYLRRAQILKYYFLSGLYLKTKQKDTSHFYNDVVGMGSAGLAMVVALLITMAAQLNLNVFSVDFLIVMTVGYVLKDRIKEWSKRYIIPLFRMPNRKSSLKFGGNNSVGRIEEWVRSDSKLETLADCSSSSRISLEPSNPQPEHVLSYDKFLFIDRTVWKSVSKQLDSSFDLGEGLEIIQILRLNLSHFCKLMQPPELDRPYVSENSMQSFSCSHLYKFQLHVAVKKLVGSPSPEGFFRKFKNVFVKEQKEYSEVYSNTYALFLNTEGIQRMEEEHRGEEHRGDSSFITSPDGGLSDGSNLE